MRVVLSGATGFLGRGVLQECHHRGIPVLALGRNLAGRLAVPSGTVSVAEFDLAEPRPPAGLQAGDVIVHAAALLGSGTTDARVMHTANAAATLCLARTAVEHGAAAFVFISTVAAHGPWGSLEHPLREDSPFRPVSPYGDSKARAEEELARLDWGATRLLVLRPPVIHGPGLNPASSAARLLRGLAGPVFLRSGGGRAPFNSISRDNLVHGLFHLLATPAADGSGTAADAFLLRDDPCPTMAEFQEAILAVYGRRPLLLPAPRRLLQPLGALGDVLRRAGFHFPLSRETVAGFAGSGYYSSIDKARAHGWLPPRPFADTLAECARAWYAGSRTGQ